MMESNSTEVLPHEAISIWEVNKDRLDRMHRNISDPPKLLTRAAGKSSCSIFRVPQSFVDINVHPLEAKARECYSEIIHLDTDEFLEMMVVDGCFVIELFRKFGHLVRFEENDPIVTIAWIELFLFRDLLRLENQMPYFILETLFEVTRLDGGRESWVTLSSIALNFFNIKSVISNNSNLKVRHLLDLVRRSYIPEYQRSRQFLEPQDLNNPPHVIFSISKLRRAGIKLSQGKSKNFLEVNFLRGVIEMPQIVIDDCMTSFLLNCVAYEQCHNSSSKYFTAYALLLDCLVNTERDVECLCDQNVVGNCLGTETELARFINNLGKDVPIDINNCYLAELFSDINKYYRNNWNVQWASFKYT